MDIVNLIIGALVIQLFPLYLVLQVVLPWRWRGNWRWAALAPLILYIPLVAHAIVALIAKSNLWPIMLILAAPVACLYLLTLIALKYWKGRPAAAA